LSTAPIPPDYDDHSIPEPQGPHRRLTKTLVRIAAVLFILAAGLLIAIVGLLHSQSFRQRVLRIALPAISRRLGTEVRIRDFSLHPPLATPSLSIENLVVEGVPHSQMLSVDHIEVGLEIVSMLQRKWHFNQVTIDHPVIRLEVNEDGSTNLPSHQPATNTNIFDLGIRHVLLRQGELYYNDRKSALEAALQDVELQSRFDPQLKKYSGRLSYRNGWIRFRDQSPTVHSLETEFEATPETLSIKNCTLTTGASQIMVAATLNDYAHPNVKGTYQATLDSADLEPILNGGSLPSGVIRLVGSAQFQSDPTKTLIENLSMEGNVNSPLLRARTPMLNTEFQDMSAEYQLHRGDLDIRNLRAQVLGGTVSGSYSMHDLAAAQQSKLHVAAKSVDLSVAQSMILSSTRKRFRLKGAANVMLEATWRKASDALVAHGSAALKGSLAPVEARDSSSVIPFQASAHGAYSAAAAEITFTESYLRMPKTTVRLNGTVSQNHSLQLQIQSDELHEVEAFATAFGFIREPVELYGAASFNGTVRGSASQPQIAGQISSPSLKIKRTEWRTLQAFLDASPSHLALRNVDIRSAENAGHLKFDASVGLTKWSYTGLSPFQIDLDASRLNISQLLSLADVKAPITGTLSARIALRRNQDNIVGQGTVAMNQVTVADETVQSLTLNFRGDGPSILAHLDTLMATGSLEGDVTYFPMRRAYDGQIQGRNINLSQIRTFGTKGIHLAGTVNLTAKGAGTLDDPGLQFMADVSNPQIENYKLSDISIGANIANRTANIAFNSQPPTLRGRGRVELTGDYLAEATLDTTSIPLMPLLAMYLPNAADLSGQTELHASISGPLKDLPAIVGQITIPTFSLAYRDLQLANTQPIHLNFRKGVFTLQPTEIHGSGANLQLGGSFPLVRTGSISLNAAGNINLKLVQIINPDFASSGELELNINGYGRRANPSFKGQIKVVDASLAASGVPLALDKGNGVLNLMDNRLDIDRFVGTVGNGGFTARGSLTFRPSMHLNLVMQGNGIRFVYPPGVRGAIDTNLALTGPLQSATLKGQVGLNELSFSRTFNVEDVLHDLARTRRIPPERTIRNLNLDLTIQSANELNAVSNELALKGAANLRIRGTVGQPGVLGSVALNGGELVFRGDRYILKPSTVDFVNPSGIEPRLNVAAETRVRQYNVRLLFRGPIDELRTTISSDPPLPPADAVNLLVFGQTSIPVTADSTGNLGAVSLLASGVSNTITNRVQKVVGISQLSIDPVLDNTAQGSTVGVTARQRVTANLSVTFISDPTSTTRQLIEVEYQATPRISVNGVLNQNGGFGADVRIHKRW
jgi:translocation and assembly module TamB